MGFYLIGPLVTLIPLGLISTWAFKPYCDDGLLVISPTRPSTGQGRGSGGRGAGILVLAAIYLRVMGRRPCLCPCPGFVPYLLECWIPPAAPLHNHVFRV